MGSAFAILDTDIIQKVLVKPWASDGENFSPKKWGDDRMTLLYPLETRLTQGIIHVGDAEKIIGLLQRHLVHQEWLQEG